MTGCIFAGDAIGDRIECHNDGWVHTPTVWAQFCRTTCPHREISKVGFFSATAQLSKTQAVKPQAKKKCKPCEKQKKKQISPVSQIAGTNTYTPPAEPESLQFVWCYVDGPAALDELRFSIRSVLKNYQGKADILVVGGCPSWYVGPHLYRKRDTRGKGFRRGLSDVQSKMDFISTCPQVNNTFVWMMDDVFMVRPTTYQQIAVPRAGGFVRASNSNGWQSVKTNTARQLAKAGYSTHDYATHLPHFVEKQKLQDVFRTVDRRKSFYLWEVMYWNLQRIKPERHTPFLRRLSKPEYDYSQIATKSNFINLSGKSWSTNFRDWLWDQFPEFSPYETGIIRAKGVR